MNHLKMKPDNLKIAVIGMACRFPGANNLDEYWKNLLDRKETIKRFSDEELSKFEYKFDKTRNDPNFVRARGILENVDKFDAEFFGITPREAARTDPQHRVWLETAWEAFENAGCDPINHAGKISVFTGGGSNTYLLNNILRDQDIFENYIRLRSADSFQIFTGNDNQFIATKTAYNYNLKGPAINIQTTCSTSLVAISEACQSLINLKSDICLAGAVCIMVPQETGYIYQEGSIHSPEGYCRPFDAKAKGTVFSNGVGAVVLKRLDDAIRDHDRIYAVVRGWATNNDGNNKISYTAPSIDGQAEVIMMAHSSAEVLPEEISYIETHGTGTQLGDPIEISGLKKAFEVKTDKKQFCGIGSVKSNIGHTDVASGVASFIKVCLASYYKKIPPIINFSEPNPHIDFENSPFFVQKEINEWNEDRPLIMGVSSFGMGGTNAHVIIEEAAIDIKTVNKVSEWPDLILLSAKSENSLNKRKQDLIGYLNANPHLNIHDVAFTLGSGRHHMSFRNYFVADNLKEIYSDSNHFISGKADMLISEVAFMFPGQGAQYFSMGKDLYKSNIVFRQTLDKCFKIVKSATGENLKTLLFENSEIEEAERKLANTAVTQPVLFIIEYALAKVFEQLGIRPKYLIGHSIGEYTAACIAGVFDMETALKIVIKRGQLMQKMQPGSMLAVRTGIEKLRSIDNSSFEIAADNAPLFCTISFNSENTQIVTTLLEKNDIQYIPLNTSHAFHSEAFEPILKEFGEYVNQFNLKVPVLPLISCLTGDFITIEQATSGTYWAQQLRNTVLFRKGISSISKNEDVVYLEIGPNTHLSSLVRQNNDVENKKSIIASLGKPDNIDERYKIMSALGSMFNIGIDINSYLLQRGKNSYKITLPSYPFDKKRHWVDFELKNEAEDFPREASPSVEPPMSKNTDQAGRLNDGDNLNREESIILEIWKSMMYLQKIDLNGDFIELGGHSLLAIQIITRIKEELNINISLKTFLENPTIEKLAKVVKNETSQKGIQPELVHLGRLTNLPLSLSQKRLWIISQIDRNNPAYNIPFTNHLKGKLDYAAFEKAMQIMFNRQHTMFSVFKNIEGVPYCEIIHRPVKVELIDFSGYEMHSREAKILAFAGEDSRKIFDLEEGPLYRLYLLKVDDNDYFFHTTIQHMIFDGLSWNLFVNEFTSIYNNLLEDRNETPEPINFYSYDFAEWEKDSGSTGNENELIKFWQEYLKESPQEIKFPYDFIRKTRPSGLGGKEYIRISEKCTSKLRDLSKRNNSTVFISMLSALGALFQKYTGENDICIGVPVSHRPHSKLEKVVGMFVNTILVRLKIPEPVSYTKLISNTKDVTLTALSSKDLPFEKIVEAVKAERNSNSNPLFQVALAWQDNYSIPFEMNGLTGERITVPEGVSPFDITFYLWENGDIIEGEIEYSIDILKRETIVRFRDHFLNLLNNLTDDPNSDISSVQMMSDEESKKILNLSGTQIDYPKEKTLIQLFEEQTDYFPDKTAVVFKDKSLTYSELNNKANQLARTLRGLGVKQNTPVGLLVEKSLDLIVGILGILKAGGGYVPIDPEFPDQRKSFIINDSGCKIILAQKKFMNEIIEGVIIINLNLQSSYHKKKSNLENINNSSDLAYIMYTSGTTGVPKGSMILQYSVIRLVRNINYMEITSDDRILLTGAIVFDATTFEIWGSLLNGCSLYIVEKETILDASALGEELNKNDITILWITSSLFTQIAESRTDIFNKLKYLLSGGDVLSAPHINKVRKDNPGLKVINCYGPTENTTFSTTYLIEKDFDHNIPIGKPINNSTTYIFDKYNNFQPVGVIGELFVGGDGLSKGYLNREDLNSKCFIENPYIPGERLYKTGDYSRWMEDGNIEFHGRIDNQLKIRGFRVELEEIENAISELEGVIETVITPIKIEEGDIRLAAFLNVSETFALNIAEISSLIRKKLPAYMIPSVYKLMRGFPKTINGKTDKKALIIDQNDLIKTEKRDLEILSPTEKIIYDFWVGTLKTKDISVNDNFFEIGGNSLLAISVFSKIESTFKVKMNLRVFFDSPRIKDLGETIDIAIQNSVDNKQEKKELEVINIVKGQI